MTPGMWFQIELKQETMVAGMFLDSTATDYPRGYEVTLSKDGKDWGQPIAKRQGKSAVTEISFEPVEAKFIRITQTGSPPEISGPSTNFRL